MTPAPPAGVVTFNKDVAQVLYANCASCHRPANARSDAPSLGGASPASGDPLCIAGAPFSVLDYASVQKRAKRIAEVTRTRAMPPWLPERGHGDFVNERRLSDAQIALLQRWAEQGAPEGDPAARPQPPAFPDGWQLGTPDLVLKVSDAYTLRPGERDVFRNFVVPVPRAATRYVRAIEFRADNPTVIHHANVAIDPVRVSRRLDRLDADAGFASMPEEDVQNVFGWSPGKVPVLEPPDTAWALEEGSDLVVQLHLVPRGRAETVQPSLGLFLTDTPPTREPIVVKLESKAIDIRAGEAGYILEDSYVLPVDVDAVGIYPHAHYLAKEMRGTATLPDGTVTPLLWIRQWDVRWQDQYRYQKPVFLPKGTVLSMRFSYDNSDANPRNPRQPPVRVKWGPRSTDEMGALWLEVVPRRPDDAALLARDYFARSLRTEIAGAELQVRTAPADAAAHNLLAMKYVQAGRIREAQDHLREAVRLQPGDAEAQSNLGTVMQMQGRINEGMPYLAQAARLKPDDDRVHFNLGNGLQASGRSADAMREYRRAIELNADNADAHFNLAMLLGPGGQVDEAIAHLARVIEINPRHADAHRNLSVAYGLQGRIDDALREVRTALRIDPESAPAREQLNRLLAARR